MTPAKHTPGPWTIPADSSGDVAIHGGIRCIATVWQSDHAPADANARLIAAAPDLLEALKLLLLVTAPPAEAAARAAIAKAEGG